MNENDKLFKEALYKNIEKENQFIVSALLEALGDKIKKYIIVFYHNIRRVHVRVFSTNKNSRRFVEAILSYEFVIKTPFEILIEALHESIRKAIELTIKEMAK
jgi:hypothetical protein